MNILKTGSVFYLCLHDYSIFQPKKCLSHTNNVHSTVFKIHIPCLQVMFTLLLSTNMLGEAHVSTVISLVHITTKDELNRLIFSTLKQKNGSASAESSKSSILANCFDHRRKRKKLVYNLHLIMPPLSKRWMNIK